MAPCLVQFAAMHCHQVEPLPVLWDTVVCGIEDGSSHLVIARLEHFDDLVKHLFVAFVSHAFDVFQADNGGAA